MATNYPGSLDTSTQQPSPSASTEMDDAGFEHDAVHTNHSGAIIALETKVGTGSSSAVADSVLAGTGSGTSGWSTAPSLAGLTVDTNTLHVDATNNRVGIGTTSPGEPLHIVTASSDAYLKQENGTTTTFLGPDSSNTGLFGTSSNHDVRFITNNSERLRIDTSGDASMAGHLTVQSGGADSGIVLGQAFSSSYVGLRTAGMAEASNNEYVLISDGAITLLSGGTNGDVYIRGGANNSSCQILLDTSENNVAVTGTMSVSGIVTLSDEIRAGSSSAADPAFTFDGDADTGLYRHTTNELGVTTGGTQVARFASNGIRVANGSAATPAYTFINDSNTGFYITGNNGVIWWSGNNNSGGYLWNGGIRTDNGSASTPSHSFSNDTNTGMYRNTADQLSLTTGGTVGLIAAAGTVNTAGLSTSSTSGFKYVMRNSTYGTLYHYTSSADVKENITNVTASDAAAWIDSLQPVTYNEKWLQDGTESDEDRAFREADIQVGFIADDVLANSTSAKFAQVENVDGTLKGVGWKWECVIAAAVAEIKSLRTRVADLEAA